MNKIIKIKNYKGIQESSFNKGAGTRRVTGGSLKGPKGITLLALVITIVLMLILASVTVNVAINGGLFEYAGNAKESTEIVSERQTVQKASIIAEGQSKTGRVTVEEMQKAINNIADENTATAIDNGDTIAVKFNNSERYYYVDNKGNVEGPVEIVFDSTPGALDGTGTEADPFIIMSIEDLVYFSKQVNEGTNQYSGKYVALGKTLDFNSDLSYINLNTTEYDEYLGGDGTTGLKEQLTNGLGFRPIGETNTYYFRGSFNGNNNAIENIKIDVDGYAGLFGYTYGEIKGGRYFSNLTLTGEISGTSDVGGLIGFLYPRTGYHMGTAWDFRTIVENIKNECTIVNKGTSNYVYVGGIIGQINGNASDPVCIIKDCYNKGHVEGVTVYHSGSGGICGKIIGRKNLFYK